MKQKNSITFDEYVKGYKSGNILIYINENRAGDFVMSEFGDKHNKPAHVFWSWAGIILTTIIPIVFLFINWKYSVVSFILGLVVASASRKSAVQFCIQNMLESEDFWNYIVLHQGAVMKDKEGNVVNSAFLDRMEK